METWKKVTFEPFGQHYEVSDHGRVRRIAGKDCAKRMRKQKIISLHKTGGYIQVMLCSQRTKKFFLLHHLVASSFIGQPPTEIGRSGSQINHKDGNKSNNLPYNLEWCTSKQNHSHAVNLGLKPRGEKCRKSLLKEKDISDIRRLRKQKHTLFHISKIYNVSIQTIFNIVNRTTWQHVTP